MMECPLCGSEIEPYVLGGEDKTRGLGKHFQKHHDGSDGRVGVSWRCQCRLFTVPTKTRDVYFVIGEHVLAHVAAGDLHMHYVRAALAEKPRFGAEWAASTAYMPDTVMDEIKRSWRDQKETP
jgi:hypothetical protein